MDDVRCRFNPELAGVKPICRSREPRRRRRRHYRLINFYPPPPPHAAIYMLIQRPCRPRHVRKRKRPENVKKNLYRKMKKITIIYKTLGPLFFRRF